MSATKAGVIPQRHVPIYIYTHTHLSSLEHLARSTYEGGWAHGVVGELCGSSVSTFAECPSPHRDQCHAAKYMRRVHRVAHIGPYASCATRACAIANRATTPLATSVVACIDCQRARARIPRPDWCAHLIEGRIYRRSNVLTHLIRASDLLWSRDVVNNGGWSVGLGGRAGGSAWWQAWSASNYPLIDGLPVDDVGGRRVRV